MPSSPSAILAAKAGTVRVDDGATITTALAISDDLNEWQEVIIDLTPYLGKVITIRFEADSGSGFEADVAIDDITVAQIGELGAPGPPATPTLSPTPTLTPTITPTPTPPPVTVRAATVALQQGWNLLGFGLAPDSLDTASEVLASINSQGNGASLIASLNASGLWKPHLAGLPFADFAIEPYTAYAVYCTQPGQWTYAEPLAPAGAPLPTGPVRTTVVPVKVGWSLIGFGLVPDSLDTAGEALASLDSQGNQVAFLAAFGADSRWRIRLAGLPLGDFGIGDYSGVMTFTEAPGQWTYEEPLTP